jgi:hypothetical protein
MKGWWKALMCAISTKPIVLSLIAQPQPFLRPPITCILTSLEFCTLSDLSLPVFALSVAYYTINECNSHP